MKKKYLLVSLMLASIFLECQNNTCSAYISLNDLSAEMQDALKNKKTTYGEGEKTNYYLWSKNEKDRLIINKEETKPEDAYGITYNYDDLKYAQGNSEEQIHNLPEQVLGNITGDFKELEATEDYQNGGAIYNGNKIGNITGDFVKNSASQGSGSAIYNDSYASIGDITGDFVENTSRYGGAVSLINHSSVNSITGNFINNKASTGAAIYNTTFSQIGDINAAFIGNISESHGGAIYNITNSIIQNITGDFVGNEANGNGGAIYNISSSIQNINGNFIGNKANSYTSAAGGAIYNGGNISDITGDFIGNYTNGSGGAIYTTQTSTTGNIKGDFIGNFANSQGAAIYNSSDSDIGNIDGNFIGNSANNSGGAIYNIGKSTIGEITGNFVENYSGYTGGAIYNSAILDDINGDFIKNTASRYGGAIYNLGGTYGKITGNFIENHSEQGRGGAIYHQSGKFNALVNSSFYGNYTKGTKEALGGAIYAENDITITADNGLSAFSGNYVQINDQEKDYEAVYMKKGNLTLNAENNGIIHFDDKINGANYTLNFDGDSSGNININNDINKAKMTQQNVNTNILESKYINNKDLNLEMNSGNFNVKHLDFDGVHFNQLTLNNGNINLENIDVDLVNKKMGGLTADSFGNIENGKINVKSFALQNDSIDKVTPVVFNTNDEIKDSVVVLEPEVFTPLYEYGVSYSTNGTYGDDTAYMVFSRNGFNPAVMASSVAQQLGGFAAMTQAYDYSFNHADKFSALPQKEKFALENSDKYAINDENEHIPLYKSEIQKNAFWIRPYTSFESVPLKNGPKVSTVNYGTIIGADSSLYSLKNGWKYAFSGYAGYNGSNQSFRGIHTYQNGGLLGAATTFYKNKFYSALTGAVGANVGESDTMYGSDNYTMLMTGIASKSGYNFEFNKGRFILQPTFLMSYTFLNTFDYTSAAGFNISSDPLHVIQLHPDIKFVFNTESGWQPYLAAGAVYNIMDNTNFRANDVQLTSLSIKPYAEYGAGIQKIYNDNFTGYAQAMVRNGGRNGVALTFGLRSALGRDNL